jgi:hypothetical protein
MTRKFRQDKLAKMTNRQLKNYTRKRKNACLKNPRVNTLSVKKYIAQLDLMYKALAKMSPDE